MVTCGHSTALLVPLAQPSELTQQDARLNGIHASVVAFDGMLVFARLAVVAQHPHLARNAVVIGRDCTRFTARSQVFSRVKAESGGPAHASRRKPCLVGAREILCSVRLTGILNHHKAMAAAQL